MSTEKICRTICIRRFVDAVLYSSALQFLLLAIFILLKNFSLFHPFSWINGSLTILLSFRSYICLIPLIAGVILYGICLGKQYLHNPPYYPTRALWIYSSTVRNSVFLAVHMLFGLIAAWMHSKYFTVKRIETTCDQRLYCVRETTLVSILYGIYVSCYFFFIKSAIDTKYSIVQQNIYIKIRSKLVTILTESFIQSIGPLFTYLLLYVALRSLIKFYIITTFSMELDDASIFNLQQVYFLWTLGAYIQSNMMLIRAFFKICVEKYITFAIDENKLQKDVTSLTLTQALSSEIMNIRKLGSYDLFSLANGIDATRRSHIFALSIPGGHPYNWTTLNATCLQQIDSYCESLSKSIDKVLSENKTSYTSFCRQKPIGITASDKLRFRHYNQNYGIRKMTNDNYSTKNATSDQINDVISRIKLKFAASKIYIMNLPGINYLFGEKFNSKIEFYLRDTETISWTCQGLSSLAAQSLQEDKYGVVHNHVVKILTTLLKFKKVMDKIYDTRLDNESTQSKCVHLRNTICRCLFQLCSTFEEYLSDLIIDPNELHYFSSIPRNPDILNFC